MEKTPGCTGRASFPAALKFDRLFPNLTGLVLKFDAPLDEGALATFFGTSHFPALGSLAFAAPHLSFRKGQLAAFECFLARHAPTLADLEFAPDVCGGGLLESDVPSSSLPPLALRALHTSTHLFAALARRFDLSHLATLRLLHCAHGDVRKCTPDLVRVVASTAQCSLRGVRVFAMGACVFAEEGRLGGKDILGFPVPLYELGSVFPGARELVLEIHEEVSADMSGVDSELGALTRGCSKTWGASWAC